MTTFTLYGIWKRLLGQWLGDGCPTRQTNLAWLIVGLYVGSKVQLSAIVKAWPFPAQVSSLTRRLRRFLDNGAVRPAVWYRPVARRLLARAAGQPLTVILDGSKVGAGHQLVIVALAYRHRALPLAWSWVAQPKGAVRTAIPLALCRRVHGLLPADASVTVVGDAGFANVRLLRQWEGWGWHYVVRQKRWFLLQRPGQTHWEPLGSVLTAPGQPVWLPQVTFTVQWQHPTGLLAVWQPGYARPWLLTTNLSSPRAARQAYARRMWIEEMFGDWKGHGWDLETTHLRQPDRLSRLVLALALLYVWLVLWGAALLKAGQRAWVDRPDRRDLSLFRIGLDTLRRCCALPRDPPVPLPNLVAGPGVR